MDLSTFLAENCNGKMVNEAVRSRDVEKAVALISKYLSKRRIYTMRKPVSVTVDGARKLLVTVWNDKNQAALFQWDLGASAQIEAVGFTSDFDSWMVAQATDQTIKFDVHVLAKGANVIQMVKLVEAVLTGEIAMSQSAICRKIEDAQLFEDNMSEGAPINEADDDPYLAELKRKKGALYMKIRHWTKKGKDVTDLQAEYDELLQKLNGARATVRTNVTVTPQVEKDVQDAQFQFEEEERATPEERFEDMEYYVKLVCIGRKPFALLCGAPGVGKTFRVMKLIESLGKRRNIEYKGLKGKCTPSALYTSLHDFKDPGQLCVFDDCDSVLKDPDSINIIKAAYDSSDERYVSWNISTPIVMSEEMANACDDAVWNENKNRWEYPKEFLYEGGGIIITNYSAGQIDTAIRNRALICDLSFTVNEVLDLIEKLAPKIQPGILDQSAKERAMEYLHELADKGAPVELSIRSFTMCAEQFMSDAPEKSIRRRIAEQMKNQFLRGGVKY